MRKKIEGVGGDVFDSSAANGDELQQITLLRESLKDLLTQPPLAEQAENVSDWKLLRFLRGYSTDVDKAAAAYRDMVKYRQEHNIDTLRSRLVESKLAPHELEEYKEVVQLLRKGLRYTNGMDLSGNLLTVTDIGELNLRQVIAQNLVDVYVEYCCSVEEYTNILLHSLCGQQKRLVGRHDVLNVLSLGLLSFNKACFSVLTRVMEAQKHYPEAVVKITSAGNGKVAVMLWRFFKPLIPARTKRKLRVLGVDFVGQLLEDVPVSLVPLVW
mmetsp:Transcript_9059/g.17337  ORF Transcript_9059/g.17337 Transcript_9059/m.17337 type:complete len:270 (+) Transcript_9059:3-812(+)